MVLFCPKNLLGYILEKIEKYTSIWDCVMNGAKVSRIKAQSCADSMKETLTDTCLLFYDVSDLCREIVSVLIAEASELEKVHLADWGYVNQLEAKTVALEAKFDPLLADVRQLLTKF